MPHFFVNSALVLVGVLGLFVITLMLFSYKSNVFTNMYLVLIFAVCSIRNIIIGLFEISDYQSILNSKLIAPIFLIVVPALYLYFKSLLNDYKKIQKQHIIHFIYPALNLALNIGQVHFQVLEGVLVEDVRFISIIAFFLFYIALSFNMLNKQLWKKNSQSSVALPHFILIKDWTLFLFVISTLLFFRILFSIYSEKLSNDLFQAHNYSFVVIIPWLLIYGKIFINPEILFGYPKLMKRLNKFQNEVNVTDHVWMVELKKEENIQNVKPTDIEIRLVPYISDIECFVESQHPFRDIKFSFSDFAKAINISTTHLYYIFKYHAIVTFAEYKDYCRIKDALKLIDEGALNTITMEELAHKVGFSSYNTFCTSFKKQTKFTPEDYLANKNKLVGQDINLAFN